MISFSFVVNANSTLEGRFMNTKTINETISIEGVSQIDAKFTIGRVTIYESDKEEIEVSGSISGNSSRGVEVQKQGDIIYIKQKIGYFPIRIGITRVYIGIPNNYSNNLNIHQRTGNLTIKKLSIGTLNIKTTAASISVDDILFENLNLKAGSASSIIDLKRKSGNITIDSSVGKVNITIDKIAGDISFDGGTMGGNLVIPEKSPVNIINIGNSSKCKISAKTSEEKSYSMILKPGVGRIKVTDSKGF